MVYSGFFLADDTGILRLLAGQAGQGVHIRILLGDADSAAVARRGAEEGIDDAMTPMPWRCWVWRRPARQEFSVVVVAHHMAGNPTPSDESLEVCWASSEKIHQYPIHPSMQLRIQHYYDQDPVNPHMD